MFMYPIPTQAEMDAFIANERCVQTDIQSQSLRNLNKLGDTLIALMEMQASAQAHLMVHNPQPGWQPPPDLTIPYDRLCRNMRRNTLLERRLAEVPRPPLTAPEDQPAAAQPTPRQAEPRQATDTPRGPEPELEAGPTEAEPRDRRDRLDPPDEEDEFEDELGDHPFPQIVAEISRDLELVRQDLAPAEATARPDRAPTRARVFHPTADPDPEDDEELFWVPGLPRKRPNFPSG